MKTSWWYLSYAMDDQFLGPCIVRGESFLLACENARNVLGVSPGGQVLGMPIPEEELPKDKYTNQLLSKEDVVACWSDAASIAEHRKRESS